MLSSVHQATHLDGKRRKWCQAVKCISPEPQHRNRFQDILATDRRLQSPVLSRALELQPAAYHDSTRTVCISEYEILVQRTYGGKQR